MNTFNRTLLNEMKNSAFLLCNVINNEETIIDDDDKTKTENESDALLEARSYDYKLEKASNIYLIDDTILQQIFNPLRYVIFFLIYLFLFLFFFYFYLSIINNKQ